MALVSHYGKNPFSGTDVVRDSDGIVGLFEPSLRCLGLEGVVCTCSTVCSHDHNTSWAKCLASGKRVSLPRREVGEKGHAALGSWKAVSLRGWRERAFVSASEQSISSLR